MPKLTLFPVTFIILAFAGFANSDVRTESPIAFDEEWMALLLDGQKTGHVHSTRTEYVDRVEHTEEYDMQIKRSGVTIGMRTRDTTVETLDGKPLGFVSDQEIGGGKMTMEGVVAEDGTVTVTTSSAGTQQTQTFDWPDGALMAEGLRLKMEEFGTDPGTRFDVLTFVPSSLQAAPLSVLIGEEETVDLFGVEYSLIRTEHTMDIGATETTAVAWMDTDWQPKKMRFSLMGLHLETLACPKECATAMAEPAEFFARTFAHSPEDLDRSERSGALAYVIRATSDSPIYFPTSQEQQVSQSDATFSVRIAPVSGETDPVNDDPEDHLGSSRWLQTDQPEITELAARARGDASTPHEIMESLERFVRGYVSDKNLSVGYATALETARNRSGDCTEHALLLAALGRASGVPTRIATGLAYVERWLGAEDVFVPHAWTQALIDGRWISFDAALGQFDSGHLALSYGDGDPWNFYDGVNTLGNFVIESIEAVE